LFLKFAVLVTSVLRRTNTKPPWWRGKREMFKKDDHNFPQTTPRERTKWNKKLTTPPPQNLPECKGG
jgi:hypothetical protein